METSFTLGVIALFSILVGISIVLFWMNLYAKRALFDPNSSRSVIETKYHLVAELVAAAILIMGGTGISLATSWGVGVAFAGLGMLLYANINGVGFYARKNDKRMVWVFYVTIIVSIAALVLLLSTL